MPKHEFAVAVNPIIFETVDKERNGERNLEIDGRGENGQWEEKCEARYIRLCLNLTDGKETSTKRVVSKRLLIIGNTIAMSRP